MYDSCLVCNRFLPNAKNESHVCRSWGVTCQESLRMQMALKRYTLSFASFKTSTRLLSWTSTLTASMLLCTWELARHGAYLQFKPGDRVFAMTDGANVRDAKGSTAGCYRNIALLHVHAVTALRSCSQTVLSSSPVYIAQPRVQCSTACLHFSPPHLCPITPSLGVVT